MKYIDEYRQKEPLNKLAKKIHDIATRSWTLMEICGGQTHAIVRFGLDELLPDHITLVHGPGCPVCVTPTELIDQALAIASLPEVIFCSFGDMLRVPGSKEDLQRIKARGGDIRMVYSPMDALALAKKNPNHQVVFFAVGFETTAPANAMAVYQAQQKNISNFSMLVSHVLVPPAIEAILSSPQNKVQGLLAAGHVCSVMGYHEYEPLVKKYNVPIVVTGFEPVDIMQGVHNCVKQLEEGRSEVENAYTRSVIQAGNRPAQELITQVFEVIPRRWRGIGDLPHSGLGLKSPYDSWDAAKKFNISSQESIDSDDCISGLILQGQQKPADCPSFGNKCTPEHPLGATMVSTEGACAAYYLYRRHKSEASV